MALQQTAELGNFVLHLHDCCLHEYHNKNPDNVLFNGESAGQDDAGCWILPLQPCWCPDCIQERSHAITIGYDQCVHELENSGHHVDQAETEKAYLKGVRDGRLAVLSTSFAGLPGW